MRSLVILLALLTLACEGEFATKMVAKKQTLYQVSMSGTAYRYWLLTSDDGKKCTIDSARAEGPNVGDMVLCEWEEK